MCAMYKPEYKQDALHPQLLRRPVDYARVIPKKGISGTATMLLACGIVAYGFTKYIIRQREDNEYRRLRIQERNLILQPMIDFVERRDEGDRTILDHPQLVENRKAWRQVLMKKLEDEPERWKGMDFGLIKAELEAETVDEKIKVLTDFLDKQKDEQPEKQWAEQSMLSRMWNGKQNFNPIAAAEIAKGRLEKYKKAMQPVLAESEEEKLQH